MGSIASRCKLIGARLPTESQEHRPSAGGDGLFLVAGRWPVGRPLPPIARSRHLPLEPRLAEQAGQDPAAVARIVGGDAQFAAVGQQVGEAGHGRGIDDAPLPVAFFRPGVGEQHENPLDGGSRQPLEEQAGVVDEEADVDELLRLDVAQEAGDAVEIGLDADQPDLGVGGGLPSQVLAAAEADLEPDARPRRGEQGGGVELAGRGQGQPELGQQPVEPVLGLFAEPGAALAAVENAPGPSGGLGPGVQGVARRLS